MQKTRCAILFVLQIAFTLSIVAEEAVPDHSDTIAKLQSTLEKYLQDLAKESNLGFTVVLNRQASHPDGTVQQVDSIAISSNPDNETLPDNFDLAKVSQEEIKKILVEGEEKHIQVSFFQQKTVNNTKNTTFFDTPELHAATTAAAKIPLDMESFAVGLQTQVCEALDMSDKSAVIEIVEVSKDGTKKRITTTVQSHKVIVKGSQKMSARNVQEAAETLKKAYKINLKNRNSLIAELFSQKFDSYSWQVLKNSKKFLMKFDTMVNLVIEGDEYHILGNLLDTDDDDDD